MAQTKELHYSEREHLALLLVRQYPFLKGSYGAGHQIWSKKIMNRVSNINKKAKKKLDVNVSTVTVKGKSGRKKMQSVATVIPDILEGETTDTLEEQKKELKEVCLKGSTDLKKINQLMESTYPLRRREILVDNARVWKLLKEYPPLGYSSGSEIRAELERILGIVDCSKAMKDTFRDTWKPRLLSLLKTSDNKNVKQLWYIVEDHDEDSDEKEVENRCIMTALPFILGERKSSKHQPGENFWKCVPNDAELDVSKEVEATTAPRLISSGDSYGDITNIVLAAEGMVVCCFKKINILTAVVTLLASYYLFNASYPKGPGGQSKNVFLFLEHIMLPELRNNNAAAKVHIAVEALLAQLKRMA